MPEPSPLLTNHQFHVAERSAHQYSAPVHSIVVSNPNAVRHKIPTTPVLSKPSEDVPLGDNQSASPLNTVTSTQASPDSQPVNNAVNSCAPEPQTHTQGILSRQSRKRRRSAHQAHYQARVVAHVRSSISDAADDSPFDIFQQQP